METAPHFYGHVAVEHGDCSELADAGPLGCVIDVHVEGQAVAQAVNQTVVHHEVHAAVAADLLGDLAHLAVNRVHVFLHEGFAGCLRYEAVGAEVLVVRHLVRADVLRLECEALDGVLVGEALGTGQLVLAVVGAGGHDVVVYLDHLAASSSPARA